VTAPGESKGSAPHEPLKGPEPGGKG